MHSSVIWCKSHIFWRVEGEKRLKCRTWNWFNVLKRKGNKVDRRKQQAFRCYMKPFLMNCHHSKTVRISISMQHFKHRIPYLAFKAGRNTRTFSMYNITYAKPVLNVSIIIVSHFWVLDNLISIPMFSLLTQFHFINYLKAVSYTHLTLPTIYSV